MDYRPDNTERPRYGRPRQGSRRPAYGDSDVRGSYARDSHSQRAQGRGASSRSRDYGTARGGSARTYGSSASRQQDARYQRQPERPQRQRQQASRSRQEPRAYRQQEPRVQRQRHSARPANTTSARRQAAPSGTRRLPSTQAHQGGRNVPARQMQPTHFGGAQGFGKQRRRSSRLPIIIATAVVVLLAVVLHFVFDPPSYQITLNGQNITVGRGATIQSVIDEGYASPTPGNLLAVDESVITEGGGDQFAATVNGEAATDPATPIGKNAEVSINNGADVTESFTSKEKKIEHGTASGSTERDSYWFGSLHVYSEGKDGKQLVKTGDVSGIKVKETIEPAVDAGYSVYTADVGDDKVVALTFDDGPWPDSTKAIVDIFEKNNAKATFFTIGQQVGNYADQVKRAHDLGCEICTHTWDHADGSGQGVNLTYMSEKEQVSEVKKGYKAIKEAIGEEPQHIMRAPGGNYYGELISTLEPYVDAEIGWDVDTEDWRQPGADAIYNAIMSVQPGQVVLMHDGGGDRSQTVKAVKKAVPDLIAQGYQLVTVSDLLAYGTPSNGSVSTLR